MGESVRGKILREYSVLDESSPDPLQPLSVSRMESENWNELDVRAKPTN